jgi:hypothetical protein
VVVQGETARRPFVPWDGFALGTGRLYVSGEYLLWWVPGQNTPPLVTTSPANVPQAIQLPTGEFATVQATLGQPTTAILFGGSRLDQDAFSGGRFRVGYWLDDCQTCAVEVGGFFVGERSERFDLSSDANPVIARPFSARTPLSQMESVEFTATPGINPGDVFNLRGSIHVDAPTRFWGAEVNARHNLCCGCDYRVDALVGYRHFGLEEGLGITEDLITLTAIPGIANVGDRIVITDRFDTRNYFHGGQVGAVAEWRRDRWVVQGTVKVALGNMHQRIDIAGRTTILPGPAGGAVQDFPAGLLALGSNSGSFSRDRFAVIPEVGVKLGYQLTDSLRAFVGYDFLYISNVVRPGDQIDRVLDVNQIPLVGGAAPPPPARPLVPFRTTDFWAQGLSVGLELRY